MSGINYQHMAGLLLLYYALLKFLFLKQFPWTVSAKVYQLHQDAWRRSSLVVSPVEKWSFPRDSVFYPQKRDVSSLKWEKNLWLEEFCFSLVLKRCIGIRLMFMYKIGCCTRKRPIPPSHARWQVGARMAEDFGIRADLGEIWWEANPGSTQSGRAARGIGAWESGVGLKWRENLDLRCEAQWFHMWFHMFHDFHSWLGLCSMAPSAWQLLVAEGWGIPSSSTTRWKDWALVRCCVWVWGLYIWDIPKWSPEYSSKIVQMKNIWPTYNLIEVSWS